jgi:hypothetical protein
VQSLLKNLLLDRVTQIQGDPERICVVHSLGGRVYQC